MLSGIVVLIFPSVRLLLLLLHKLFLYRLLHGSHLSFHPAIFHYHFPVPLYSSIVYSSQIEHLMHLPDFFIFCIIWLWFSC